MSIRVNLDLMLARRKMRLSELADAVGITLANLSILKTGKARAIRFSTLEKICVALECAPGDILDLIPEGDALRPCVRRTRGSARLLSRRRALP